MPKKWWWKFGFVCFLVLLGVYFLLPSFWSFVSTGSLPSFFGEKKIRLGLDLQGGLHLVLSVDLDKALSSKLELYADELKESLKGKNIDFDSVVLADSGDVINVRFKDLVQYNGNSKAAKSYITKSFGILEYFDESSGPGNLILKLRLVDKEKQYFYKQTVRQSLETIRNRIDEFGVSEPAIQTRGTNRIIIQLPGVSDPERAKALIGRTAKLEFKLVDKKLGAEELERLIYDAEKSGITFKKGEKFSSYVQKVNEFLIKRLPEGTVIAFKKEDDPVSGDVKKIAFLLKKVTRLTGEDLRDAYVQMDHEMNEPFVSLTFNPRGAKIFADLTGKNVGEMLAIVLDGIVDSAPRIKDRISGGRAKIELGSAPQGTSLLEEARDLAITLRAGALPADIEFLEERTVGPSLGRDSIVQGLTAMKYGSIAVLVFMLIYYNLAGLMANIALILNIIFIGTVLTAFQATLTLPGIAGIVLTIGMAVDANVIIFERIREEFSRDHPPASAVDIGFSKALTAIVDANITTAITALVLLQYGSGPIKGFAVTLLVGILCSLFTAVFVTKMYFELFTRVFPRKLSI